MKCADSEVGRQWTAYDGKQVESGVGKQVRASMCKLSHVTHTFDWVLCMLLLKHTAMGPRTGRHTSKMMCYEVIEEAVSPTALMGIMTVLSATRHGGHARVATSLVSCLVDTDEATPQPWPDHPQDVDLGDIQFHHLHEHAAIPGLQNMDITEEAHYEHQVAPSLDGQNQQSATALSIKKESLLDIIDL